MLRSSSRAERWSGWKAFCTVLALLTCSPSIASAEESAPRFTDRLLHAEGRLGIGTLLGIAGGTLGVNAFDWLEVGAGAGSTSAGFAVGGYARFRPLWLTMSSRRLHALTVELGYSIGPSNVGLLLNNVEDPERHTDIWNAKTKRAHFVQFDVGWETRAANGFTIRLALGVARSVHGEWDCEDSDGVEIDCPNNPMVPTITLGLGF